MNKHALIIGANSPSAIETTNLLIKNNYKVSLISKSKILNINNSKKLENIYKYRLDITKSNNLKITIRKIIKKMGNIDTLIFFQRYRGNKYTIQNEMDTSLNATTDIIETIFKYKNSCELKSIIAISSVASTKIALEQPLSYHLGKAALNQLIRYYGIKLGNAGIRVNGIEPALIYKDRAKNYYKKNEKLIKLYKKIIPLKRMGHTKDIANLILFLSSENSNYITGQIIKIDGGVSLHESVSLSTLSSNIKINKII
tara:strand:+ start:1134 stop:1901 length:768 start_codon:yes stop_codon:yes gene_type:complete